MGYYVAFFVLTDIRDARSEPIASFQSLNPTRGRKIPVVFDSIGRKRNFI